MLEISILRLYQRFVDYIKTDITTSITASPIERTVIKYVEFFKTDVIVFMDNVLMFLPRT